MAASDQDSTQPVAAPRRRGAWICVLTIGILSGSALLAVPAIADDGSTPTRPDRVVVCESGVVDQGAVQTSSAIAVRVGESDPVPDGCRET